MNKLLFTTALVCGSVFAVQPAFAQNLDYGTMQEMFGEPVTTSANGSPMRASDVPLDMTIISAEDIARYPAREIPDILRHYAGVSVRQNTNGDYSVGIRGYNQPGAERLLVLVNGRQVYEDYYGLVSWDNIPVELSEIRQIEIVRGPNTALFGFNATSGVINIVTYNPLFDDVDLAEADVGLNGYKKATGVYTFQNDGVFGARLSVSGSEIDEDTNSYSPAESNILKGQDSARSINADVVLKLNDTMQMRFEGSTSDTEKNAFSAYYDGTRNEDTFTSLKANLTADTDYGIIDATIYRNNADAVFTVPNGRFGFKNSVIVAQLSDTFKLGTDHTFRIAGEFRDNSTDHAIGTTTFGTTSFNIKSLSTLWYWNINEKLALSTAGRYDHVQSDFDGSVLNGFGNPFAQSEYNNVYDEFGYNIGLIYKPTDVDTLRFSAAKGVDLPSAFEVGVQAPSTISFFGNPNLDVSDVHDFQIGYERNLPAHNTIFKLTGFYQQINELQGFTQRTATLFDTGGVGDSIVYGGSVSLDGETSKGIRWCKLYLC